LHYSICKGSRFGQSFVGKERIREKKNNKRKKKEATAFEEPEAVDRCQLLTFALRNTNMFFMQTPTSKNSILAQLPG
jgi:hypothetical protein